MKVQCPCCKGTGTIEAKGGKSDASLLRSETIKVWNIVERLEAFIVAHMEETGAAITTLVDELDAARSRIDSQNGQISSLETRLAIYGSWNSRTSDNPEHYEALKKYREAVQLYRAERNAGQAETVSEKPEEVVPDVNNRSEEANVSEASNVSESDDTTETRREFRRRVAEHEHGITPKKTGGQPNHKGRSRNDKPERTIRLTPDLCIVCGTVPDKVVKIIRIRVYDVNRREERVTCVMCVICIMGCSVCNHENWPITDLVIPGTSFGPVLRRMIVAYHSVHVVESDMKTLLEDLDKAEFSEGAISNCVSAIAAHLDAPPICMPEEEPITICDTDALRVYRSPLKPPPTYASDYAKQDAALTCRSTLWSSFVVQPRGVQMMERASMDPWGATDETGNKIGNEDVQTLASHTIHVVKISIELHRDAPTLQRVHGWMVDRPGMRDGTKGFEWHKGLHCRCGGHVDRKSEDFAMKNGIGSIQYTRHLLVQELYHDAKEVGKEVERRAGGPIRCASQLGIINKIPGLAEYVEDAKARLSEKAQMIIESFPRDGFTTTLENAYEDMHNPVYVPGLAFQNNGTEGIIRDDIVVDRRRYRFPNEKAAKNFAIIRSFSATCRKNGISPYEALKETGNDMRFDIFNVGIPPPIFGGGASECDEPQSTRLKKP